VTVLLAYVATAEGDAALTAAVTEAQRRSTDAVVVHVTRPDQEGGDYSEEQTLDAVVQRFRAAGVSADLRHLPAGTDPVDAVVAAVEETGAEVAIIGLRRRTAVGKLVLGSTAQRLLLGLDCQVLAVKAPR
jgi:nucleotide-binding universal stress UspA family protein